MQKEPPSQRNLRRLRSAGTRLLRWFARMLIPERSQSDKYADIDWSIRIVVAVAINILFLQFFASFLSHNTSYSYATIQTTVRFLNGSVSSNNSVQSVATNFKFLLPPSAYVFYPSLVL